MHRSSYRTGLLHASSCSPNVQVSLSHSTFHFFFFFPVVWPCLTCLSRFLSSCGVLSRLRRMDPGAEPVQYSQLLDCMCSWGQAAAVLELATDWLTEALPKQGVSQHNTKERRRADTNVHTLTVKVFFLSSSGQDKHQSKGANPGDGGGQTRPGSGVSGVPVQPRFSPRESPGSWREATEAAPCSSRKLEGTLDIRQTVR